MCEHPPSSSSTVLCTHESVHLSEPNQSISNRGKHSKSIEDYSKVVHVVAVFQDLAAYSKHKDKSVVVAARSFINFIREVYPSLLKTRDRGKDHDISARPAK